MIKKDVKNAWARAVNNKEYKPYKDETYGNKVQGRLNSVHYMVYNIVRDLPIDNGFVLDSEGFNYANTLLKRYYKYDIERLLFPFEGFVTIEDIREKL